MSEEEHPGFAKEIFWWLVFGVVILAVVILYVPFITGLV